LLDRDKPKKAQGGIIGLYIWSHTKYFYRWRR
jgi:hypothetical protein